MGLAGGRPLFIYFLQIHISVGRCGVTATATDGESITPPHKKLVRGVLPATDIVFRPVPVVVSPARSSLLARAWLLHPPLVPSLAVRLLTCALFCAPLLSRPRAAAFACRAARPRRRFGAMASEDPWAFRLGTKTVQGERRDSCQHGRHVGLICEPTSLETGLYASKRGVILIQWVFVTKTKIGTL